MKCLLLFLYSAMLCLNFSPLLAASSGQAVTRPVIGVVDYNECWLKSKISQKQEKDRETLRTMLNQRMEEKKKSYIELSKKLQNKELLETLSSEKQKELEEQLEHAGAELNKLMYESSEMYRQEEHNFHTAFKNSVMAAAEKIALSKHFTLILNKDEICIYAHPKLDITAEIIRIMDESFTLAQSTESAEVEQSSSAIA